MDTGDERSNTTVRAVQSCKMNYIFTMIIMLPSLAAKKRPIHLKIVNNQKQLCSHILVTALSLSLSHCSVLKKPECLEDAVASYIYIIVLQDILQVAPMHHVVYVVGGDHEIKNKHLIIRKMYF